MFETLTDVWYVWLGLTVVAAATLGVALGVPTVPPPDAESAAASVDAVAGRVAPGSATHAVTAERVRVEPGRLTLANDAGVGHATFAFGPVVPVTSERLVDVASGATPETVFESVSAFADALGVARDATAEWRVGSRLLIRHVSWGGEDVTLVGVA